MSKLSWIDWFVFGIVGIITSFILGSIAKFVGNGIELFSVESPLVFPFLIGVTLLVCLILTIFIEFKKTKVKESVVESKELLSEIGIALLYIIGVLIYSVVLNIVGFMIGSIIFLIIGMIKLNFEDVKIEKRFLKATVASCIVVPLLYYVFHEVFKVMLP